jgi:uncharacterized protein (TIGR02646 family)
MIKVDRSAVSAPSVLSGAQARAGLARAAEHFATQDARSEQAVFEFEPVYAEPEVITALSDLFAGKCAFCESPAAASAAPIRHHFRPKQEAVNVDGEVSRPHYWWLVYDWENLYFSCQRCATAAGARFPVRGARARTEANWEELRAERALLVDPCWDEPADHLVFDDEGVVAPRSEKGEYTIDTYSLNRRELVAARQQAIADALSTVRMRMDAAAPTDIDSIVSPRRAYAAAVGQAVARFFESSAIEPVGKAREAVGFITAAETLKRVTEERERSVLPLGIERVEIRNFRGIKELNIDLTEEETTGTWAMLLGENGFGKTSVLQAIALALMGQAARDRLKLSIDGLVHHDANYAEIKVQPRGALEPRVLYVDRRSGRFEIAGDDTPAPIAAYGAGRVPPTRDPGRLLRRYRVRPRIASLFDSHAPLMPARRWLLDLDEDAFNFAARALKRLVLEPEESMVARQDSTVLLLRPEAVSLEQLSDGYRAMIALAADLMSFFIARYGSMDAAEGIVLVDELGAHLHPRWQMQIVGAFREAFPRLQFVATTHDPLCLRGLDDSEVVVLRRTESGQVYALPRNEVPSVRGLRVDELLTSEVFGLSSTIDPELEGKFDDYYALLSSPERGPETEGRIAELRDELAAYRQLGSTRRERLALEAADEYLANERDRSDPDTRTELSRETKARLRAIWAGDEV